MAKNFVSKYQTVKVVLAVCIILGFLGFSFSARAAVEFAADTIVSLSGISDGGLSIADTSGAGTILVSGSALTVADIPDGDSFILKTAEHSNALKITPSGGTVSLEFDSGNLSTGEIGAWTLSATGSVQVAQIVGVPNANAWYAVNADGALYNKYQSNSSSEISFTYSGGWSSKVFTIAETTAPVSVDNSIILEEDEDDDPDNLDISKAVYVVYKDKIVISWKTNRDSNSRVRYGVGEDLDKEEYNSRKVENHRIILNNLSSDTLYYFRLKSTDEYGNDDHSKIYSARTKTAVNWGIDANGFFFNQDKETEEVEKSLTEQISELPGKIVEKIGELKFFNANVFKKNEKKYLSEVKFQLKDEMDNPLSNLNITLYSDPKTTTTDENGYATFKEVEVGQHTLKFSYLDQNRKFAVNIQEPATENGAVQMETVVIRVGEKPNTRSYYLAGALAIVGMFIMLKLKRKK